MKKLDLWTARTPTEEELDDEAEDSYISCGSDISSDDDEWYTPPQSPNRFDSSDDEMNVFEESLESFEEEKGYSLFIEG